MLFAKLQNIDVIQLFCPLCTFLDFKLG